MNKVLPTIYINQDEWDINLDTREARLKIEKGHTKREGLDGKLSEFVLDGLHGYGDFKEQISIFTIPAEIQIYADYDVTEFSIVLDKDFLVYRSNELPELIRELFAYWEYRLDHSFHEAEKEEWERKQKKLELKK